MLEELQNNIDFFIRNKTKFSRKNFVETNPKILEQIKQENLYTQDVLEQFFKKRSLDFLRVLDIGAKNWFYAKGEHDYFSQFCNNFIMDGVELDAYRLYYNFYSRFEVAKFYTKGLDNTNYIPSNLLDLNQKYDYIIWFLPFVFIEPLKKWGLPKKHFQPQKLLNHAYKLLNQNGQMLIINQGEIESFEQQKLLEELEINYDYKGEVLSKHFSYKNKRYAYLITK